MRAALIDTDILSYFLAGNQTVSLKIQQYIVIHNRLTISNISYFEILAGLEYKMAKKQIAKFELFISKCRVLKPNTSSIKISARIYGELRRQGIQIGTPDLLIAGLAIDNNMELIINNEKHYSQISEIVIGNWARK